MGAKWSRFQRLLKMEFITAFKNTKRSTWSTDQETLTKQASREECDINNILSKYRRTGVVTHLAVRPGGYTHYNDSMDFKQALDLVIDAENDFASLPSDLRRRFNNDPYELLQFIDNNENYDEAVQLGLIPGAKEAPAPAKGDVQSPPTEPDVAQ